VCRVKLVVEIVQMLSEHNYIREFYLYQFRRWYSMSTTKVIAKKICERKQIFVQLIYYNTLSKDTVELHGIKHYAEKVYDNLISKGYRVEGLVKK